VKRVVVVGVTGVGKTTFAAALSERLGVPHIELDALYWQPHWTPLDRDEFRARIATEVARDGWVIEFDPRVGVAEVPALPPRVPPDHAQARIRPPAHHRLSVAGAGQRVANCSLIGAGNRGRRRIDTRSCPLHQTCWRQRPVNAAVGEHWRIRALAPEGQTLG